VAVRPHEREDDWDVVHGTHLRGAFLMSRAASRFMAAADWGRIVNISNTCPGPAARRANHMAAAAGLHGLTRGLAAEIGQFGVTVNSVAVGPPAADLAPDEVAKVVAFLVSEQAADLTGRVLSGR
jgi:3-oxoacyl-[acyl-carrier protein] reductase